MPTLQPVTKYTAGATAHIAYQVMGRGPAVVIVPGLISHLEIQWEDSAYRSFVRRLAAFSTVVRFDKRGTGLSDPVDQLPTLEERDADLAAVIAAAGVERPFLMGYSEGGPIAIRFAAPRGTALSGLILYGTSAHNPPDWAMERLRAAVAAWGSGSTIDMFAPNLAVDPAARAARARFERASASPAMARALVEALLLTGAEQLLQLIDLPTLVLHRTHDFIPLEEAHFLAHQIASSRLVELPGVDHPPWYGDAQPIIDEIEQFVASVASIPVVADEVELTRRVKPRRPASGWASLTSREQAVTDLLVEGYSNTEIARRLYISRQTVETHLKHIFGKLGLDSRAAVAGAAKAKNT